jgi:hypothetical protein
MAAIAIAAPGRGFAHSRAAVAALKQVPLAGFRRYSPPEVEMDAKHPFIRAAGVGLLLALSGAPQSAAAEEVAAASPASPSAKITTRITAKGEVIAEVKVAAKTQTVREMLASAERSHNLAPTTVSAHATRDGDCEKVKLQVRGLITPFQLETRRCPTSKGFRETLIGSTDFVEYHNEWVLKDLGAEGTLVTFKTRTMPNVQVLESLILMETRRVLARLLKNLVDALGES